MTKPSKTALLCGLTAAALAAWRGGPAASQPAAAPAQPPALTGPLVPGVCLLSREELITGSRIGGAATDRLRSLTQQVQTSLEAEKAKLERRGAALNAQRATISPAQYQAQGQAISQRAQALQAEAAERSRQIDATRNKVLNGILHSAEPYIAQAFAAHACGLLVSREAIFGGNMANDLTPEVLAALDAKAAPMTFDLEPPPAAPTK